MRIWIANINIIHEFSTGEYRVDRFSGGFIYFTVGLSILVKGSGKILSLFLK